MRLYVFCTACAVRCLARTALPLPGGDQIFWKSARTATDSGQRATSRRREGAKERRERRLRAEARIRLQLCRDAVRIASHWRAHTDAPVIKYVAPAPDAHAAPATVSEDVALAPACTCTAPSPGIGSRDTCTCCHPCNTSSSDRICGARICD